MRKKYLVDMVMAILLLSTLVWQVPVRAEDEDVLPAEEVEIVETPVPLATVDVYLTISTHDATLFSNTVTVSACDDGMETNTITLNVWCAIQQVAVTEGWSIDSAIYPGFGVALTKINQYDGSDFNYWLWFHNNDFANEALNAYELNANDNVMLVYGTAPMKMSLTPAALTVGTTTTIAVEEFGFDSSWNPAWLPAVSSTITINGVDYVNDSGSFDFVPTSAVPVTIAASKAGKISPQSLTLIPLVPTPTTAQIHLGVYTYDSTLYNANLTVTLCDNQMGTGEFTLNAWCAIEQAAASEGWNIDSASYPGFGLALTKINQYDGSDFNYWLWFHNNEFANVAFNDYLLNPNDDISLVYGVSPLKMTVSPVTSTVGATTTISVEEFGFDSSWMPTWLPAVSSTITVNGTGFDNDSGLFEIVPNSTDPITVTVSKTGFVSPASITIAPVTTQPANPPANNSNGGNNNGGGSAGGSVSPTPSTRTFDVPSAIQFLSNKQRTNGSILDSTLYSDWAAIAFASYGGNNPAKEALKQYLLTDPSPIVGFNETADYARRSMALLALGINPYSGTPTNYIQKLVEKFDATQFGDPTLVNDDIFALTTLLKAGFTTNDQIIASTTAYIVSRQGSNGAWFDVDQTAAAIQTLTRVSTLPGVSASIQRAKDYLHTQQQNNGSFNQDNVDSTSWALQSIFALGEQETQWKLNQAPSNFIASKQAADGGVQDTGVAEGARIWSTAYAIPAALGRTWNSILTSVSKPSNIQIPTGGTGPATDSPVVATSTTPIVATATTAIVAEPEVIAPEEVVALATPEETAVQAVAGVRVDASADASVVTKTAEETTVDTSTDTETSADIALANTNAVTTEEASFIGSPMAKGVFATTAVAGSGVGLYLIWKFLQGLV